MSRTFANLDLRVPAISEIAGSPRTASRLRSFPRHRRCSIFQQTLLPRRGTNGALGSCSYGFRTILLTTRRFMSAPTKGFILIPCSKNRRLLQNVFTSAALAAVVASGASIRPTSAHAQHNQTRIDGRQTSHSARIGDTTARGYTRRGARDLLASSNLSQKDDSAETGRSSENSGIASVYSGQGGIKFDPSRPRQINLAPGMGGAAAKPSRAISAGNINVSGHKPGSKSHGPRRLHHEKRNPGNSPFETSMSQQEFGCLGHFCVYKKTRLQSLH
jgi:hypothetical protein